MKRLIGLLLLPIALLCGLIFTLFAEWAMNDVEDEE